jgi:hypothetical protein
VRDTVEVAEEVTVEVVTTEEEVVTVTEEKDIMEEEEVEVGDMYMELLLTSIQSYTVMMI